MKKLLSALLLVTMLLVALASCGGGSKKTTPAATTTAPSTPAATTPPPAATTTPAPTTTTDIWESIATDVKALDEASRTFKFELSSLVEGAYDVMCDDYMAGPDSVDTASSTIQTLVYERNTAAKNALGVNITYTYNDYAWGGAAAKIQEQTNDAANTEAADMFAYTMYDMVIACFNSSFRELSSINGSYFDWEADGWHYSIMSDMSFDREKIYVMASDYFNELYRNMMVLPFNMTMVDNSVTELGAILLPAGTTLQTGEVLSDYLFEMVNNGKWTWDVLTQMCQAIWLDNNGDTADDKGDRVGIYLDTYGGNMASAMLYSTEVQCLTDVVDPATGKIRPTYPTAGDAINGVFLAVGALVNANGSLTYASSGSNASLAAQLFAQGLSLTPGLARIGELEHEEYQVNMKDTFSVVPIPLVVAGTADDYNTCIHNTAILGAFNINSTKYLAMSAYIQFVSENSEEIKDEYLEILMKFKTTTFNQGTSEMLDLIYGSIKDVRQMILDNVLRQRKNSTIFKPANLGDPRWHGIIKGDSFKVAKDAANGAFLTKYDTIVAAKQQGMDELMTEWAALPTAPVPATPAQ